MIWLASDVLFFGALFAAYFTLRADAEVWPPPDVDLVVPRALVFTLVLVASSFTMERAVAAAKSGSGHLAVSWLAGTVLLGVLFIANQTLEYTTLDFAISTHAYGTMYYLMTGFHLLHVAGGIVVMVLLLVMGGRLLVARESWIRSTSYFWHFVDVVWVVLFATIYLLQ